MVYKGALVTSSVNLSIYVVFRTGHYEYGIMAFALYNVLYSFFSYIKTIFCIIIMQETASQNFKMYVNISVDLLKY